MGGKTDLDRVTAYVPPEWKQELEEWAEAEERSISWLVSKLIGSALQERREQSQPEAVDAETK
ncbi:CopG family transcriptional regulator [Oculatella sp. FACHB-28]|uniref:ribbon-helix-helix domain-containing protein n=1 Tax=Cyanophyceae TaxID=3028117 RepID=UPI001685325E|nr:MULTISPECIES: CopG family transcriptional regulator [Cyanophyceae]MBD1871739.1 CopG family transcriptional regulator [Cyanobacteria bacterium FACHB-471]MBD2057746.1 CopG family transcriptional regulator [Oculatella sp. FACHB-28]MBD2069750.1 CopG family transcriptional regulator [Leptolyngbya sp. FACHB-671]